MNDPSINLAGASAFRIAGQNLAESNRRRLERDLDTAQADSMRDRVGELVGQIFYGTLLREMQASKLKGPFGHGGRGEEVFQGQLNMELAMRIGRSGNNPITDRLYEDWFGRLRGDRPQQAEQVRQNGAAGSQPASTGTPGDRGAAA